MNVITKTVTLPDGRTITIETGKLAKQADGAVTVRMGNTVLLATVVAAKEAKPDVDFMPLQVEYKEKFSAVGRFPGGFTRREGRASDYEILICRLVDRALRPLFPDDYHAEVYVNVTLFSGDLNELPDQLAGLAASAALAVSDIPFHGPISEVRVVRVDGEFLINPTAEQLERADLDLMVAATLDNIMMVEGEMKEVQESEMLEAIKVAHEAIKDQCRVQVELMEELGTTEKRAYEPEVNDEALKQRIHDELYPKAFEVAMSGDTNKHSRGERLGKIVEDFKATFTDEELEEKGALIDRYYHDVEKEAMRRAILDHGKRLDGRETRTIRPIWCEVDCLPSPHGSAIFTRGETQSLSTVTLGTKNDEKLVDDVLNFGKDRFLLHYNFPPFSTGEAKASRGVSRREIGHGNLAMRALKNMIPENYPYVIRVMSDILESNGSSSMATVCAGTLALMDAGVKIKKPVSGIAMGLISENKGQNYAILSDILGDEDHLGDMDFKVTGTRDGITATQMDIKVDGLSYEILENALAQAREGRLHILDILEDTIAEPRADFKPQTPRITTMLIPKEYIGQVIGPGGKIIQGIQEESGASVNIEETDEGGVIEIAASNKPAIDKALEMINAIVVIPEVGKVYDGTVKSVMPYGAFVEFLPGKEGLLHISEWDWKRFDTIEETGVQEGQKLLVKLLDVDPKTRKFRLSRRAILEKPEGYVEPERRPRRQGGNNDRRNNSNSHRGDRRGGHHHNDNE